MPSFSSGDQVRPALQSVSVPKSDRRFSPALKFSDKSPTPASTSSRRLAIGSATLRPALRSPRSSATSMPSARVSLLRMPV